MIETTRLNFNLKRDDLVLRVPIPSTNEEISELNMAESVRKVRDILDNWIGLTEELLHELWIRRRALRKQGKKPKNGQPVFGWGEYCKAVGLKKATVNRWLRRYDPKTKKKLPKPKTKKSKTKESGGEIIVQCPNCDFVYTNKLIDRLVKEAIQNMT